jgi:hypothetical protein
MSDPKNTLANAATELQSAWAGLLNDIAVMIGRTAERYDDAACAAHDMVETPSGAVCAVCVTRWPCDQFHVLAERRATHRDERLWS